MWTLRLTEQGRVQKYPLREGETLVGRGAGCDIVIVDESMSRRHARIIVHGETAKLEDLESRNGVFRNGTKIESVDIAAGDTLRFGAVEVVVEVPAPVAPEAPQMTLEHTIYRRLESPVKGDETVFVDAKRVLRLMSDVGKALVASLTLPEVLTRVVELLLANIPAEKAVLLLIDQKTGELVPTVSRLRDGRPGPLDTPVSKTLTDLVLRERAAVLSSDVEGDSRFENAPSLYKAKVRSLICGPLATQNENIGVLSMDNALARRFSEADLELFTALANYASTAIAQARLSERVLHETEQRQRLARYHSPAVVDLVLRSTGAFEPGALIEEREASVLFTDVVGFTSISETMTPQAVAQMLNGFFSAVTDVVFEHEGTVDKFIGDAVMAVFGAPLLQADHALRAVRTGLGIVKAVKALNESRPGMPTLRVRVGINSGTVLAGDVGSSKRLEYTVLGDVVNIASRMESSIAKPGQVVISRAVLDRLTEPVATTPLGAMPIRGRAASVEVFALEEA